MTGSIARLTAGIRCPGSKQNQTGHLRHRIILASLVLVQAASAVFFVWDVINDYVTIGLDAHTVYEAMATISLVLSLVFSATALVRLARKGRRSEAALQLASARFTEHVLGRFVEWRLTPAETDVALLALKGFSGPEIAGLRGSADGTVRAQLARIYAKSGVSNRSQFAAQFVEDLLDASVVPVT